MNPSLVLLSAGLDSAVNFKCALDREHVALALTFDYRQRAARQEVKGAAAMCERFGVRHEVIKLPWLGDITRTALVGRHKRLPHPRPDGLDDACAARCSAERVWVPNRNGVFLAVAAAYAEALGADGVVAGFNAEEAAAFPDNSAAFVRAYNRSLQWSTRRAVKVVSYTARLRKDGILALGRKITAPLDLTWACYEGGRRMCGRCESCLRFVRAVQKTHSVQWFQSHHNRLPPQLARGRRRS